MMNKEKIPAAIVQKLQAINFNQLIPLIEGGLVKFDCRRKALWVVMVLNAVVVALLGLKCLSIGTAAVSGVLIWAIIYPLVSFVIFYFYSKHNDPGLIDEYKQGVAYVKIIEGKEGFLWKFEEFLKLNPSVLHCGVDRTIKAIIATSKRGRVIDFAHYTDVISQLQDVFL